ncbi:hypothetical protein BDZ45DRAFT_248623 [Acephala macrosclerotiorum]|nr:hypothetical protein BDZ45DRAFT_248623 [Acephala macrosclerotiorum]
MFCTKILFDGGTFLDDDPIVLLRWLYEATMSATSWCWEIGVEGPKMCWAMEFEGTPASRARFFVQQIATTTASKVYQHEGYSYLTTRPIYPLTYHTRQPFSKPLTSHYHRQAISFQILNVFMDSGKRTLECTTTTNLTTNSTSNHAPPACTFLFLNPDWRKVKLSTGVIAGVFHSVALNAGPLNAEKNWIDRGSPRPKRLSKR